jgi:hypothetical protein
MAQEQDFDRAMYAIYERAKAHKYYATYFKQMLDRHGGLDTAKRLLREGEPQQGLYTLWELDALGDSVEATILKEEFRGLFTNEELAEAEKRLRDLGYSL